MAFFNSPELITLTSFVILEISLFAFKTSKSIISSDKLFRSPSLICVLYFDDLEVKPNLGNLC